MTGDRCSIACTLQRTFVCFEGVHIKLRQFDRVRAELALGVCFRLGTIFLVCRAIGRHASDHRRRRLSLRGLCRSCSLRCLLRRRVRLSETLAFAATLRSSGGSVRILWSARAWSVGRGARILFSDPLGAVASGRRLIAEETRWFRLFCWTRLRFARRSSAFAGPRTFISSLTAPTSAACAGIASWAIRSLVTRTGAVRSNACVLKSCRSAAAAARTSTEACRRTRRSAGLGGGSFGAGTTVRASRS